MAQRRAPTMEATAAAESIGGPKPIIGLRRAELPGSVRSVAAEALRNRRHTSHSLLGLLRLVGATIDTVRGRMIHQPAQNRDSTRLPAALHGQLIGIYRDNTFARPGGVVVVGGTEVWLLAGLLRSVTVHIVRGGGHPALLTPTDELVPLVHQFFSKN